MESNMAQDSAPWDALEFVTVAHDPQTEHVEYVADNESRKIRTSSIRTRLADSDAQRMARVRSLVSSSGARVEVEHRLGGLRALRLYYKAIGWSVLLSLTIVMEGYDTAIVSSFYA